MWGEGCGAGVRQRRRLGSAVEVTCGKGIQQKGGAGRAGFTHRLKPMLHGYWVVGGSEGSSVMPDGSRTAKPGPASAALDTALGPPREAPPRTGRGEGRGKGNTAARSAASSTAARRGDAAVFRLIAHEATVLRYQRSRRLSSLRMDLLQI